MKNLCLTKLLAISLMTLVSSCAHHKDVRPGADGVHRVLVTGEDGGFSG